MKKKVLIIGGGGYIGTHLCNFLLKKKINVEVIDPMWFGNNLNPRIKIIKKKIQDVDIRLIINSKITHIIYLAGLSNDPMANLSPKINFENNLNNTVPFLFNLKNTKIKKIIFASSCSVYGYSNKSFVNENSPIKVQYPYGITKYLIDREIEILNKISKTTKFISLRKGTVSGFSERMRFDLIINTMIKSALTTNKIDIYDHKVFRPILDIDDLCRVYYSCITDKISAGIYNIYSYQYNIYFLAKKIKKKLKSYGLNIQIKKLYKKETRSYKVSRAKFVNEIKFKFSNVDETIDKLMFNLKNFSLKELNSQKYINVSVFKKKFKIQN